MSEASRMSRRGWLALLGLLPVAAAAFPIFESLERRRRPGTQRPVHGFHRDYFPDLVLRTQDDERVRLYTDLLAGKTVLVHFFYGDGRDGLCPAVTANLVQLQRLLGERCGRDVFMYSFTLAPEAPARLRAYRASYPITAGWTFLTGSAADLALCRARFGVADPDPALDREPARHVNVVLLGNEPHERWLGLPALSSPGALLEQLDRVAGVKT
ncbi:MAG TPA: SCO family protein [Verrucomicrobiae bacterium]|nr:SCO family protein [Verrucomicrobiae bacterium]